MSTTEDLLRLLSEEGIAVRFDLGCNNTFPCTFCGTHPPVTYPLRFIGWYPSGEDILRPVCGECAPIADKLQEMARAPIGDRP